MQCFTTIIEGLLEGMDVQDTDRMVLFDIIHNRPGPEKAELKL